MKKQTMQTIAIIFLFLFCACADSFGQTKAVKDKDGNYKAVTIGKIKSEDTKTANTFTDNKGQVWPIYKTASGKVYALRTSAKSGKEYKQYISED